MTNLNFQETDSEGFRKELIKHLDQIPKPAPIENEAQMNRAARDLTAAIQATIATCVKRTKPRPDAERWWNGDHKKIWKKLNRLRTDSYRHRAITDHKAHQELRTLSNHYGEEIVRAKRQHWSDYLEEMKANEIWNASKYLRARWGIEVAHASQPSRS